jgi:hypothetical protein
MSLYRKEERTHFSKSVPGMVRSDVAKCTPVSLSLRLSRRAPTVVPALILGGLVKYVIPLFA